MTTTVTKKLHVGDLHWDEKPGRPAYPPNTAAPRLEQREPSGIRERIALARAIILRETEGLDASPWHQTKRDRISRIDAATAELSRCIDHLRSLGAEGTTKGRPS